MARRQSQTKSERVKACHHGFGVLTCVDCGRQIRSWSVPGTNPWMMTSSLRLTALNRPEM